MQIVTLGNVILRFWGRSELMDLNNLALFRMVDKQRSYLSERQKVLATNVANANTPNYLPKDIEKPDFSYELEQVSEKKLELTKTNPNHLDFPYQKPSASEFRVYTPKPQNPLSLDGNGVVIEDQLNEISKNKGDYNRMVTIYTSFRDMLKTANTKITA